MRWGWLVAGLGCVVLAIIGAFLPVMPSTIFAILAAGAFARSSPRLERWVLDHPWFGRSVRAWREQRAIPVPAKVAAVGSMTVSGVAMAVMAPLPVALAAISVLLACAGYVATRPAA